LFQVLLGNIEAEISSLLKLAEAEGMVVMSQKRRAGVQ
jgi:hypothetical protein